MTPMPPGTVYWITGLSGAGKTTLAEMLAIRLRGCGRAVIHLDGDVLRELLGQRGDYSRDQRLALARRYTGLCREISRQGVDVVCSTISMFHDVRRWNRENLPDYVEIFLSVPFVVLMSRDRRGVYQSENPVMGLHLAPELPDSPDIVIHNHGDTDVQKAMIELVSSLGRIRPNHPLFCERDPGMSVAWDYTTLAPEYSKRPPYADRAIDELIALAGLKGNMDACDIGAGTGHLTLALAVRRFSVAAVEPNEAMRAIGIARTSHLPNVRWHVGTGEASGQPSDSFDLVAFGSSFNVTDRHASLVETVRLLRDGGWFACMWNHRDLSDPLQARIEAVIAAAIPGYDYGLRREDQTDIIDGSGLFGPVRRIEAGLTQRIPIADWRDAWRSHGTLQRQAGERFAEILAAIDSILDELTSDEIQVPYVTRIWAAQRR